jgi:hypothetical protein
MFAGVHELPMAGNANVVGSSIGFCSFCTSSAQSPWGVEWDLISSPPGHVIVQHWP